MLSVIGKQADEVQRKAQNVQRPKCGKDRKRQRNCRNDGGAPIAQEQKNDKHGESCSSEQRFDGIYVVSAREFDGGVDQFQVDIRRPPQ